MKKIPVISSEIELNERTEQVIARFGRNWEPVFIADATKPAYRRLCRTLRLSDG